MPLSMPDQRSLGICLMVTAVVLANAWPAFPDLISFNAFVIGAVLVLDALRRSAP